MLKYININNIARKELELSLIEYAICEMVYHLSNNPKSKIPGWCNMSRSTMADELGMSRSGIIRAVNRLIIQGVIKKDKDNYLKTTLKWYENVIVAKRDTGVAERHIKCSETPQEGVAERHTISNSYINNDSERGTHTNFDESKAVDKIVNAIEKTSQRQLEDWAMKHRLELLDIQDYGSDFANWLVLDLIKKTNTVSALATLEDMTDSAIRMSFANSFLRNIRK